MGDKGYASTEWFVLICAFSLARSLARSKSKQVASFCSRGVWKLKQMQRPLSRVGPGRVMMMMNEENAAIAIECHGLLRHVTSK